MKLDAQVSEAAVLGGAVLGGGGGGLIEEGLRLAELALKLGDPCLVDIEELDEKDILLTVSAVGAPAAQEQYVRARHYLRVIELLQGHTGLEIKGLVSSENGALSTVNGWLQSALLGIPVVDAPCDGRAHPTGLMGSMGLQWLEGYVSPQAAVGGKHYLEIFARGPLADVADLVRRAAVRAGGMVAVARNPIPVSYVKQHGAPGAIKQAIEIGHNLLAHREQGGKKVAARVAEGLGGAVAAHGAVQKLTLSTEGGFDRGEVLLDTGEGQNSERVELTFWNEYMTLEVEGQRVATFPDLIATLDENGTPVASAEIAQGERLYVIWVPKENLILGAGLKDVQGYRQIESVIGREMIAYLKGWDELAETSAGDSRPAR